MTAQVIELRPKVRKGVKLDSIGRPKRPKYSEVRKREYLTPDEVERLMKAAKARGRYGRRDALLILLAYRHGLRVSELVELQWDAVSLNDATLNVGRKKKGKESVHPLRGEELRQLRQHRKEWPEGVYIFASERGGPMTDSNARKLIAAIGVEARLPFPIHPHMLRHATGYKLANDGVDTRSLQDYLGHRNIQHTVRYTELSPIRFKAFWRD